MPGKDPAAVNLGRKGGQARAARMSKDERSEASRKAISAYWAGLSPEERSAVMKARAKKRKRPK